MSSAGEGIIRLSDGTKLKFAIMIIDAKEVGPSPFGGVNIDVKVIGGVSTEFVPEELTEAVKDKPLTPSPPPMEGWELLDIVEQQPPIAEVTIDTTKGKFRVRVEAEAVMAARNTNFKTARNEPIYWVSWVYKISWRPEGR